MSDLFKRISLTLCAALIICLSSFSMAAMADSPQTRSIDITVELDNSGGGYVTETWNVRTVDGTEFYLAKYYLQDQEITELSVSDETGANYQNIGPWDENRPLQEKAGKCGLININNGYEICWGIGSNYGDHIYTVRYYMTNLVKGCNDCDVLYQQFVASELLAEVQNVNLTVKATDKILTRENTKIWGFGHTGDIQITDGMVVSTSLKPLEYSDYVTVLLRFEKDLFSPILQRGVYFEDIISEAFQGSSYTLGSVVNSLVITANMDVSGGAYITEIWDIDADFESVIRKSKIGLADQSISELSISDETGKIYQDSGIPEAEGIDIYDLALTDDSTQLAGKYGLIKTSADSYEIYWGIGNDYGNHVFTVNYYMSNMVKRYNDKDVLYQNFLAEISYLVFSANITIIPPDAPFQTSSTELQNFGFDGDVFITTHGMIVSKSAGLLEDQDYITILARFDQGMFEPAVKYDINSDEVLNKALEEDRIRNEAKTIHDQEPQPVIDYTPAVVSSSFEDELIIVVLAFFLFTVVVISVVGSVILINNGRLSSLSNRKMTKSTYKELANSRDIPFYGSLITTFTRFTRFRESEYSYSAEKIGNLVGAYILKWIYEGEVRIVTKSGLFSKEQPALRLLNKKFSGTDGQPYGSQKNIGGAPGDQLYAPQSNIGGAPGEQPYGSQPNIGGAPGASFQPYANRSRRNSRNQPPISAIDIESDLYAMLLQASDADNVLESKEIQHWSSKYYDKIQLWLVDVKSVALAELNSTGCAEYMEFKSIFGIKKKYLKLTPKGEEMTDRMYGFKKFLEEFTIINERDPNEVRLWNNYLIFAQVFGIADEVSRRISELCPNLLNNPDFNFSTLDTMTILYVSRSFGQSMHSGYTSGRADSSSSGGGGDFSGGGGDGASGGGSSGGGGTR